MRSVAVYCASSTQADPVYLTAAERLGRCLAELDIALRNFRHRGEQQVLIWDMQRALSLRDFLAIAVVNGQFSNPRVSSRVPY